MTQEIVRPHPTDGDLLRFLDGECASQEHAGIQEHLETCTRCAQASRLLAGATERLAAALDAAVVAPTPDAKKRILSAMASVHGPETGCSPREVVPAPRRWRVALRAAAVISVLLAAGLLASPLRAWIAELFAPSSPRQESSAEGVGEGAGAASSAVSFVVSGSSTFEIQLANPQPGGSVTVLGEEGRRVVARIVGGSGRESVVVMPNGVRFQNVADSDARYTVAVPDRLREVRIVIGTGTPSVYPMTEIMRRGGGGLVIPLGRPEED